eukprot:scaffold2230_cov187-Amphora_coffeaeformis.AAC.2
MRVRRVVTSPKDGILYSATLVGQNREAMQKLWWSADENSFWSRTRTLAVIVSTGTLFPGTAVSGRGVVWGNRVDQSIVPNQEKSIMRSVQCTIYIHTVQSDKDRLTKFTRRVHPPQIIVDIRHSKYTYQIILHSTTMRKNFFHILLLLAPVACRARLSLPRDSNEKHHRLMEQVVANNGTDTEQRWRLFGGGGNIDAHTNDYREGQIHVSMSGDGNTVAIGVPLWNNTQGKVVLSRYNMTSGKWQVVGQEILGIAYSHAGYATALNYDGTRLIVGFPAGDEPGWIQPQDSFARVYHLVNNRWELWGSDLFSQAASDTVVHSSFSGYAVAMDSTGTTVAVSAPYYWSGQYRLGQVRVYRIREAAQVPQQPDWGQLGSSLEGSASASHNGYVRGGNYGSSLALSGDASTLVVGSPVHGREAGFVQTYRFDVSIGDWEALPNITAARDVLSYTGASVDVSTNGSIVAVGHSEYNPPNVSRYGGGLVRIYKLSSEADKWVQFGGDILPDWDCCCGWGSFGDGRSLALSGSGDTVIIAAPGSSINRIVRGLVRVFRFDGQNWSKVGQTIPGEQRYDSVTGNGLVSMSDDGTRIVVGASLHEVCEDEADWECNPDPVDYEEWYGHARAFELQDAMVAPTFTPTFQPSTSPPTPEEFTSSPTYQPSTFSPTHEGFTSTPTPTYQPSINSPTPEGFTYNPSLTSAPTEGDWTGTVDRPSFPDSAAWNAFSPRGVSYLHASWCTLLWVVVQFWV